MRALTRFSHRFASVLNPVSSVLDWITVAAGVVCVVAMVVYIGFDHFDRDYRLLVRVIRGCQITFLVNLIFNLVFFFERYMREHDLFAKIADGFLLISLVTLVVPRPSHPLIPWLEAIVYSKVALYAVLGLYAAMVVCYAAMRLPGKRTNPLLLLTISFMIFIFIGAVVLMLPKCTTAGISFVDSLFVSTSAVCITGLTPVDVSVTFTPLGLTVLACLIEIGALGVVTFTCFFAMFFSGTQSIFSQLLMRDVVYSKSMSSLFPTMLYILLFTVAIEAAGAVALFFTVPPELGMDVEQKIVFAAFHSVSAFCNAGFSNLPDGMANPVLLEGNQAIYWVMSVIIVAGAVGFPILANFRTALVEKLRRVFSHGHSAGQGRPVFHLFDMNTKVVLVTFALLLIAGAVGFYFLEADNTLEGMSQWQRISQSVFNSVTPRSAGFSSVNPANFLSVTLIMVMFLMWVGGGAQSTAGGVKVNTLATICLNLRAIVTGRERVTAFHRTISVGSIRRANAVVAVSILSFTVYVFVMLILEPALPARDVVFETLSALFTVGSSLGITSHLGVAAKVTLCTAMLFGRVGLISLMSGLTGRSSKALVHYPTDNIIIN